MTTEFSPTPEEIKLGVTLEVLEDLAYLSSKAELMTENVKNETWNRLNEWSTDNQERVHWIAEHIKKHDIVLG